MNETVSHYCPKSCDLCLDREGYLSTDKKHELENTDQIYPEESFEGQAQEYTDSNNLENFLDKEFSPTSLSSSNTSIIANVTVLGLQYGKNNLRVNAFTHRAFVDESSTGQTSNIGGLPMYAILTPGIFFIAIISFSIAYRFHRHKNNPRTKTIFVTPEYTMSTETKGSHENSFVSVDIDKNESINDSIKKKEEQLKAIECIKDVNSIIKKSVKFGPKLGTHLPDDRPADGQTAPKAIRTPRRKKVRFSLEKKSLEESLRIIYDDLVDHKNDRNETRDRDDETTDTFETLTVPCIRRLRSTSSEERKTCVMAIHHTQVHNFESRKLGTNTGNEICIKNQKDQITDSGNEEVNRPFVFKTGDQRLFGDSIEITLENFEEEVLPYAT